MEDTEYLHQGFLTKSPPEHKMNRARWQRRWFVLRATDDRVILEYFKDSNRSKLKGTIPLKDCQRVDQGLAFESKRRLQHAFIFDVVTPKRKYYLVAKTEDEMKRWVENICGACGFRSEDEHSSSDSGSFTGGRGSYLSDDGHHGGGRLHSISESVRSEPATESLQESTQDSYIALTSCETQPASKGTRSLPRDLETEYLSKRSSQCSTSSGSSSSSLTHTDPHSMSAPPAHMYVKSAHTNGQVYDVPPTKTSLLESVYENHRRVSVTKDPLVSRDPVVSKDPTSYQFEQQMSQEEPPRDSRVGSGVPPDPRLLPPKPPQSNYDIVPPPRPVPAQPITETVYDVPPAKPSLLKPRVPERTYTNTAQGSSLYDVPPSFKNNESIYDIPPVPMPLEPPPPLHPLPDPFDHSPIPQSDSTTELARSLEKISMRNAQRNSMEVQPSEGIYDVPPTARLEGNNPFTTLSFDSSPTPPSARNAPPRPPKPPSMEGPPIGRVSPPLQFGEEEFEDTYIGSPALNDSLNSSDGFSTLPRPAPEGHHWLESRVHAPRKYLNVRDSPSSKASALPSHSMDSPIGYLAMQPGTTSSSATSNSSNVFTYPDQNYMMMDGSPPTSGEMGPHELYTHMDQGSAAPPPAEDQPPAPLPHTPIDKLPIPLPRMSNSHTSVSSEELVHAPPPVDRSSKPRRLKTASTSSGILPPDLHGLTNSFYATEADDVGIPVRNSRTKSFTRDKKHRSSPRGTPPMARSHTIQYTTVCHTPPSLGPLSASVEYADSADMLEDPEDAYMLHEQQNSFTQAAEGPGFPSSPKGKNKIEYLEIAHDEESATSPPPAKPSKDNNVEYITIDSEKTKALETIQQNREKSYKGT